MNRTLRRLMATLALTGIIGTATAADEGLLFESIHDYDEHEPFTAADRLQAVSLPTEIEGGTVDYSDTSLERAEFAVFEPVSGGETQFPAQAEPTD